MCRNTSLQYSSPSSHPITRLPARGMASAALEWLEAKAVPTLIEASLGEDPQIKLCAELTLTKLNVFDYNKQWLNLQLRPGIVRIWIT